MEIYTTVSEISTFVSDKSHKTIGFVPTMGELHGGHMSLVKLSKQENDITVCSIFVNPTQFDNKSDLERYPRNTVSDIEKLNEAKCDVLFLPSVLEIYPQGDKLESIYLNGLDRVMEGAFRGAHFKGVATVVKRLFDIIPANNAYFGKKDYQQLLIVKHLVKVYGLNTNIVGCETVRDPNGLALSSRNKLLSKQHKEKAGFIYKTLKTASDMLKRCSLSNTKKWVESQFDKEYFRLEYFEVAEKNTLEIASEIEKDKKYRLFIALFVGEVRLIDNIPLQN
ncbi:pantoate--beta-alanine ligase [Ichthyobacterium seriolicida]|uniref:Pantothenate synthetase n=1 Tax=Ichthyobacterium seriolicida TaxID=242600 RepID=A0A1J1EBP4_9FLAO|nr:pantoate--beta-alanine ligase [Ichthyobacterium seriolicida]BAV94928.1 pantoate-activating protein [Ichthyobacterium seriolicida]